MLTPTHLFNATCEVERATQSRDSGGSYTETFATHLTGVRCRIQPLSGDELRRYGRLDANISHAVYIEPGQDIVETDRITNVVGDNSVANTVGIRSPLRVRFIQDFDLDGVVTRLDCEEDVNWN